MHAWALVLTFRTDMQQQWGYTDNLKPKCFHLLAVFSHQLLYEPFPQCPFVLVPVQVAVACSVRLGGRIKVQLIPPRPRSGPNPTPPHRGPL